MDVVSDYAESSTITFEWTLKGIKNLFDSTKGEKKSKVTKSIRFGNNRWQVIRVQPLGLSSIFNKACT